MWGTRRFGLSSQFFQRGYVPATTTLRPRPIDATLSVTRAAEVLGVHANTVRAWSDAGRLRYYRINPRGDRRYRIGDLHRFLTALDAAGGSTPLADDGRAVDHGRRASGGAGATAARGSDRTVPLEEHEAMLELVGELSALSGSAIRDALANPGAPLNAAVQ